MKRFDPFDLAFAAIVILLLAMLAAIVVATWIQVLR